jgi:hypothetical protein
LAVVRHRDEEQRAGEAARNAAEVEEANARDRGRYVADEERAAERAGRHHRRRGQKHVIVGGALAIADAAGR